MLEKRLKTRAEHLLCSAPAEYKDRYCKETADYVCHNCGTPLCERCVKIINDPEFIRFENAWNIFLSALAIITVSIIIGSILPRGGGAVALSGLIMGVAMLITLHIQPRFSPVSKIYKEAAHCKKCFLKHKVQDIIDKLSLILGVLLIIYGIYKSVESIDPAFLILSSLGVVIILLKKEIVYTALPKLLSFG